MHTVSRANGEYPVCAGVNLNCNLVGIRPCGHSGYAMRVQITTYIGVTLDEFKFSDSGPYDFFFNFYIFL